MRKRWKTMMRVLILTFGLQAHLLFSSDKLASSSHTFLMATSSALTSDVPLNFTRTFFAFSSWPLLTSQRGLSGRAKQPKNMMIDGTAAKPSISLKKQESKNSLLSAWISRDWVLVVWCDSDWPRLRKF